MQNALIIGSSGGIGQAISTALMQRGVQVTGLSRSGHGLDVTDEASVVQAMAALEGPFDLIFVATGGLVINGAEPETKVLMEPCYEDTSSPAAMVDIETFPVYYAFEDDEIETITVMITYDDGQTERAEFARSQILMP